MSEALTHALAAVLEPAPGNTVPIPDIHRAVIRQIGHGNGGSYGAIKATLRAVGIVVTARSAGSETYAHGVALAPEPEGNNS
ncbi:hypothetical protein PV367_29780 [Streptomyces europaeiscabiei]|uniref:Uncharacterized protein n=1 Tax=Streptomyces europaeiscabiei TaxID=146819 RepID=A0AAJ2PUE0_9ACTN|nr:hypothetical protein [Streptomyces europaeiscabiei]MDX3133880.1 hypothetical protein [Streptomyces europaeiscabiei]